MSFIDKNILIAGGSSGIGLAAVSGLATAGANVYNLSRTVSNLWPSGVKHHAFDIGSENTVPDGFLPDRLHGLVYAVGSINLKPFNRLTPDDFMNDYMLNVIGAVRVIQLALPALKRSGNAGIVLISSVAAGVGMGFHSSVAAAKGAINGLTLALAAELASNKIRVNAVAPSLTDTPLAAHLLNTPEKRDASALRHPLGRIGTTEDIASAIIFLLSGQSAWMTGQIIGVDGGMGHIYRG